MKEKKQQIQRIPLDKKDKKILYELTIDGRQPLARVGKKVGLSMQSVKYRVERLVKNKVILGFITFIDYSRLSFNNYCVWIQLKDVPKSKREEFVGHLLRHPNLLRLMESVGKWDICVSLMARNIGHFYKIFNRILGRFDEIIRDYNVSISVSGALFSKTHLVGSTINPRVLFKWDSDLEVIETDRIDRRILGMTAENARIPTRNIAYSLGLDVATIGRRIRKLEENRVIQGYHALSEGRIPGVFRCDILVRLGNITPETEKSFVEFCRASPYIYGYIRLVGRWDAEIILEAESIAHLQSLLSELRETFPETIRDYELAVITKVHRQNYFPGSFAD